MLFKVRGLIMYTFSPLEGGGISLTKVFRARRDVSFSSTVWADLKCSGHSWCICWSCLTLELCQSHWSLFHSFVWAEGCRSGLSFSGFQSTAL